MLAEDIQREAPQNNKNDNENLLIPKQLKKKKEITKFFECHIEQFENCDPEIMATENPDDKENVSLIINKQIIEESSDNPMWWES